MKLAALSLFALTSNAVLGSDPGLTVRTSTGTYTGLIDPSFPSTRQWRAIPFAEPPIASRRWLPPQKPSLSPNEHHYSTKFPPSCPQFVTVVESMWSLPLTKGNLIYNGAQNDSSGLVGEATSEDCLYLSIWQPTGPAPEGGFPVLFFMTGGGWIIGGIDLPWQIPAPWVERSQSAIVVSINYRLNIFGFPNARGLAGGQQNLGIADQRAALEWTRDNIAAFGGNPGRIIHWGRSAGSISADIHAYAYHDDPIAQAYYLESGTAPFGVGKDLTYSNFSFVARNVGCANPCGVGCDDEDGSAELDCMRQVSFLEISNFIGQYGDRVADERIVFSDYEARSNEGKIARVPALISFTANEFSSLVPWPKDNLTEGPWPELVSALAIASVCGLFNATMYKNRIAAKPPVFRFQYAGVFPNLNVYDWLGAYHNSETTMIFGTYHLLDHIASSTSFQVEVSQSMQDHIMAFVKDPYNGPQDAFNWLPHDASDPNGGDVIRIGGSKGLAAQHIQGVEIDGVCRGIGDYDQFP
ncbi:unnamed protein product [Clonostachys solani]|uniref:Carboxylesterase type B domain-containing protein n=1 Tax=Clonostachys solani TaxID=160281 RepID=A0A9N9ZA13_9HYPO|nr:unnamed protein product [Clonostachys solani]